MPTRRLLWSGGAAPHGRPQVTQEGHVGRAEERGPGGKEKEWTDSMTEDRRVFAITEDWSTAALDPGGLVQDCRLSRVCEGGGCRFVVYGRVGEGRGKGVRTPAEGERSGRGGQG